MLGTENPADMMTRYLTRSLIGKCMGHLFQERVEGRAKAGLEIQGNEKGPAAGEKPAGKPVRAGRVAQRPSQGISH